MEKKIDNNGKGNGFDNAQKEYFANLGFSTMRKNMKAFEIFKGFAQDFDNGQKPFVKTRFDGKNSENRVDIMIDAKSVYVHVTLENGETFCRKAPLIENAVKQFQNVKGMLRHFSNKANLAKSNILQTRICNEKVKI